MTNCEDCGNLTDKPVYQKEPYRIRCPRCAGKHEKEFGEFPSRSVERRIKALTKKEAK